MNLENKDFNIQQLIASLFILFMISMLLSNSVGIYLVNPKLRDGSLIMESRYTITHDALDSISEDGVNSVIALGSSMTFKGLDGGCVGDHGDAGEDCADDVDGADSGDVADDAGGGGDEDD